MKIWGQYAGGLAGKIGGMTQKNKSGGQKLTVNVRNYTFDGSLDYTQSTASYFAGGFGGITGAEKDYFSLYTESTGRKPGSGYTIRYNSTKLNVSDVNIGGTVSCKDSYCGGFAAAMIGVDADFENITVNQTGNPQ